MTGNDNKYNTKDDPMAMSTSYAGEPAVKRAPTCAERVLSVRVLLPSTVALIVLIMAVTTITLFAVNTDKAVAGVVEKLHDQVQSVVEGRVRAQLDQVLTVNMASARHFANRPLGPPPANGSAVNDTDLMERLDSVVANFPLVDVHYIFFRNGRVVGVLRNDNVTSLYTEEYYPLGLYVWAYPIGNTSAITLDRNNTALIVGGYIGYERPYFTSQNPNIAYDWSWTNPYVVGPWLLFTNTITIRDRNGVFQGVMGADSYITTLTDFFATLRPTERTKVFIADPTGLLVISTHGIVLTPNGTRIAAVGSADSTVRAAASLMGAFGRIPGNTQRSKFKDDGEVWVVSYRLMVILRAQLVVAVATPEEEFLGAVRRTTSQTIGICVGVASVGLLVIIGFCVLISAELAKLEHNLDSVARLDFSDAASATSADAGAGNTLFSELDRTNESYMKLRNAIGAFRKYVPTSVVHGVLSGSIQPFTSMKSCQVAVSFQDIVGFTTMCERNEPQVVVEVVSSIFEGMTHLIQQQGGTVDKYIGDAIMSFWEVGTEANSTARAACENCTRALLGAYKMQRTTKDGTVAKFRSGAHFGTALIGNFGSSTRFSYTVVGDTVNSAARMEPMNKETKTEVLVSGELQENVGDAGLLTHFVYQGRVCLIGKLGTTKLYQVAESPLAAAEAEAWTAAMLSFDKGDYARARDVFAAVATRNNVPALTGAAKEMQATAEQFLVEPPPADLQGVRAQRHK